MAEQTMTATEAKQSFGLLFEKAQKGPIFIEKNGRDGLVVLSREEYNILQALEDRVWGEMAMESHEKGYIGVEASQKFIDGIMNAKD